MKDSYRRLIEEITENMGSFFDSLSEFWIFLHSSGFQFFFCSFNFNWFEKNTQSRLPCKINHESSYWIYGISGTNVPDDFSMGK